MTEPFISVTELITLLYVELVGLNIAKHCVNSESIFKVHREGFLLEWEIYVDFFFRFFAKLINKVFEKLGLSFFYGLRNLNHVAKESYLLNYFKVLFQLSNAKVLEGGVARAWVHYSFQ
jgi:hypothetical protein